MRKTKIILLITSILFSELVSAQQIKTFQWIGGPTYILQLGSFKIVTDFMLGSKNDSETDTDCPIIKYKTT